MPNFVGQTQEGKNMKRVIGIFLLLLTAGFLGAGRVFAEWAPLTSINGGNSSVENSVIWRATVPLVDVGTCTISGPVVLHQVIASSAVGSVDYSTQATVNIFKGLTIGSPLAMRVGISTMAVPDGNRTYTFDTYFPDGFTMNLSTGQTSGDESGAVSVLYSKGRPANFTLYSSSFVTVDASTHVITTVPTVLRSITVLEPGTGSLQSMEVYDATATATISQNTNQKIQIDTMKAGQYTFNALFKEGLTVNFEAIGTNAANVLLTYVRTADIPKDFEWWQVYFSSGAETIENVRVGAAVFGGVFHSSTVANTQLTVYDSTAPATVPILVMDGASIINESIPVIMEKGITYTSKGTSPWTLLYRNIRAKIVR